jgi:predicted DNA-binding transcriptional regulator
MNISSGNENKLRKNLFSKLKRENAFWSYNPESVTLRNCDDETLIYKTLVHLDIKEINQLFDIYDKEKIQEVWEKELCIQGDFYRRLNKFLACYYFNIDDPKKYIRKIEREHLKSIKQRTKEKLKSLQ